MNDIVVEIKIANRSAYFPSLELEPSCRQTRHEREAGTKIESPTIVAGQCNVMEQALNQLIDSAHFRRSSRRRDRVALIGRLVQYAKSAGVVEWFGLSESRTRAARWRGSKRRQRRLFPRHHHFNIHLRLSLVV